ncbi:MAG: ABC-2 transporter permease [Clostridia bacterium]|jgi:ABC-2 type transport system permease protein|nr:ABC-2 transporter permease [Clostridia bacterium]MCI1999255.1 ABC-2 transporter permease [Clostridia bacterium]MCI2014792.1 ABC-2 transporter permease [Clostridia bacterium]
MKAIYKREIKMYFNSMIGYVFIAFFVLITAIYFSIQNILQMSPDFQNVFSSVIMMFLILGPMLTMRLLSEEKKQKTDQLLLTSPVSVPGIVLGKYFAAVTVFLISLLITIIFPIIISFYGTLATAQIIGSYVGFFLLGSAFIAVGLWISSIADNQIVSAVATFVAIFLLLMVKTIVSAASGNQSFSLMFAGILAFLVALYVYSNTKNSEVSIIVFIAEAAVILVLFFLKRGLFIGFAGKFAEMFEVLTRFNNFAMGLFDIASVVYFVSFISVFLYFTIRVVEKRRWS